MAVRLGIERLAAERSAWVAGRRIGLVTNHTGLTAAFVPSGDALVSAGATLAAYFTPEHGLRGTAAPGEAVASGRDPRSGVPVHSLYGDRVQPEPATLAGLDALVYDVQDIGCRYYTVLSTMVHCARAAALAGIPFIVCDRPNPITGLHPEGTLGEPALRSFVGIAPIPIRHACTLGELALLLRERCCGNGEIRVAEMDGWRREMWWDGTGLCFVPPSPNAAGLDMALLYPGTCLLEGTNVSEGRGTVRPFEVVGAPWIDGGALAAALRGPELPGVAIRAAAFRPQWGRYAGEECGGVQIHVTRRDAVRPVALGVHLLAAVLRSHPGRLEFRPAHFDRLAGTGSLRHDLLAGRAPEVILAGWAPEAAAFDEVRRPALLYR